MTVEGFELTEGLCVHIWAQHLNKPVGGDNCCPITFVLRECGFPKASTARVYWTEDVFLEEQDETRNHSLSPALSEFTRLADHRAWGSITGANALELLIQARGIA